MPAPANNTMSSAQSAIQAATSATPPQFPVASSCKEAPMGNPGAGNCMPPDLGLWNNSSTPASFNTGTPSAVMASVSYAQNHLQCPTRDDHAQQSVQIPNDSSHVSLSNPVGSECSSSSSIADMPLTVRVALFAARCAQNHPSILLHYRQQSVELEMKRFHELSMRDADFLERLTVNETCDIQHRQLIDALEKHLLKKQLGQCPTRDGHAQQSVQISNDSSHMSLSNPVGPEFSSSSSIADMPLTVRVALFTARCAQCPSILLHYHQQSAELEAKRFHELSMEDADFLESLSINETYDSQHRQLIDSLQKNLLQKQLGSLNTENQQLWPTRQSTNPHINHTSLTANTLPAFPVASHLERGTVHNAIADPHAQTHDASALQPLQWGPRNTANSQAGSGCYTTDPDMQGKQRQTDPSDSLCAYPVSSQHAQSAFHDMRAAQDVQTVPYPSTDFTASATQNSDFEQTYDVGDGSGCYYSTDPGTHQTSSAANNYYLPASPLASQHAQAAAHDATTHPYAHTQPSHSTSAEQPHQWGPWNAAYSQAASGCYPHNPGMGMQEKNATASMAAHAVSSHHGQGALHDMKSAQHLQTVPHLSRATAAAYAPRAHNSNVAQSHNAGGNQPVCTVKTENRQVSELDTRIFLNWYEKNYDFPYPLPQTLDILIEATGLQKWQVEKWFNNRRTRDKNTRKFPLIVQGRKSRVKRGAAWLKNQDDQLRRDIAKIQATYNNSH